MRTLTILILVAMFAVITAGKLHHNRENNSKHLQSPSARLGDPKVSEDPVCPEIPSLLPCICSIDINRGLILDCSRAFSDQNLINIFQLDFPTKEFYMLRIVDNSEITSIGDIFNGMSFELVEIYSNHNLREVSADWLVDSADVVKYITLSDTQIYDFPFDSLAFYKQLNSLDLSNTETRELPELHSDTLSVLRIHNAFISSLTKYTFLNAPDLVYYELDDCLLEEIVTSTFYLTNDDVSISLNRNKISKIEPGSFVLPSNTSNLVLSLQLHENELTTIDQEIFGDIWPFMDDVAFDGNPLECGCDMAWIITNPDYFALFNGEDYERCGDGTHINNLDPEDFKEC